MAEKVTNGTKQTHSNVSGKKECGNHTQLAKFDLQHSCSEKVLPKNSSNGQTTAAIPLHFLLYWRFPLVATVMAVKSNVVRQILMHSSLFRHHQHNTATNLTISLTLSNNFAPSCSCSEALSWKFDVRLRKKVSKSVILLSLPLYQGMKVFPWRHSLFFLETF